MKFLIITLLTLFSTSCNSRQIIKTDVNDLNLKGNVKSVRILPTHKAIEKFEEVIKGERIKNEQMFSDDYTIFNKAGYIIESNLYGHGQANDESTLVSKSIINYDINNKKIEKNNYYASDGRHSDIFKYKYNKLGQLIEEIHFDDNGDEYAPTVFKYDKNGNMVEKSYDYKYIYKYDNSNRIVEIIFYDHNGILREKSINKYDNLNQIRETKFYNFTGESFVKKYNYDSDGNETVVEEYDLNGKKIKTYTYKYKLDKNKNWTTKIEYLNGFPKLIYERNLEYFE